MLPNSIFYMNHHILIAILSLGMGLTHGAGEIKLSSLSTGVKDTRQVFVGIENKFLVEDSGAVELINHGFAKLEGNTLNIKPSNTGPFTLRFIRNQDTTDVEFQSRILSLATARPTAAQHKSISKAALAQDSTVTIEVSGDDDFYKGFKLAHFVGSINNNRFNCDTSFCSELMEAIRQSAEGDLLKITSFELVHEETGRKIKFLCNTPFAITQ